MGTHIELITTMLEEQRNNEQAVPMANYMKNHFPFLGIKKPERSKLTREFFQKSGIVKEPLDEDFVIELWNQAEREYQYVALDYLGKMVKKLDKSHIRLMETLLTFKSWWDTVDTLASNLVGPIVANAKELIPEVMDGWAVHENMWLRRTAILFQLKYKQATAEEVLYRYILENADSNEFFIQKAIGWALREYSKTNPDSVRSFIEAHTLKPLSVREGSKYI